MQILTREIGDAVLRELKKAAKIELAVAFFSPIGDVFAALAAVPDVTLVLSGEFTINDPYKLEKFEKKWTIRCVEPESDQGKLHAKVLIVTRKNGSKWVLLGSANMTDSGLFTNQEACVAIESDADGGAIEELSDWFAGVFAGASALDLDHAKQVFDARAAYRLEHRPSKPEKTVQYWALKTTSGKTGESHWEPLFKPENVIAIGWSDIKVDPSKVSDDELLAALVDEYPDETGVSVDTIRKFIGMNEGDLVIICRGYTSKQSKPVMIYGLARVLGPFIGTKLKGQNWHFRHPAAIQILEVKLPRDVVAKALGRETLMKTLHELSREDFERFIDVLRAEGLQPSI